MNSSNRHLAIGVLTVILCLSLTLPVAAQFRAGIQGTVTDPNGGSVPAATVTLTNKETGLERTFTTPADGVFTFPGLAPGAYSLSVAKTGFSTKVLADVQVGAEQMQSLNVELAIGETSQSVTVSESVVPLIDTETAMITGTITTKEVQALPSFGRDPYKLMQLTPGVFGDNALNNNGSAAGMPGTNTGAAGATDSIFKVENGVQMIANGARQNSNNFQIDGVSVNSTAWGGAAVITPNEESVKEVKVIANNYSAEYGRTSGAQVAVVSQNGTNEYHGSLFFKWHRPGLNAYQAWNGPGTPTPVQRDENRFNQYGGSAGGPILKNKLFAFFSYETLRNDSGSVATGWYETSQFLQNAGPPDSIARKLLSYPGEGPAPGKVIQFTCAQAGLPSTQCQDTPNGLDLGSPLKTALGTADPTFGLPGTPYGIGAGFDGVPDVQLLQTNSPNKNTSTQYNGRMDYQATSKDMIAFSIYHVPITQHFYNGPARAANHWNHTSQATSWTALYTRTFSPNMINEARFGVSGWKWNEITANSQEPWGLPTDYIDGIGAVGVQFYGAPGPSVFDQKTYNARDTLTKIHNSHSIKMGVDFSRAKFLDEAPWSARPGYNFRNLWNFANDAPYHENANFDPVTGSPTMAEKNLRFNIIGLFVQDDWKIKSNLTINVGLRWEYFSPLTETKDNISNVILGSGTGNALTDLYIHKGGDLFQTSKNNWGPQIGFAWSPKGLAGLDFKDKLALRGGFGIGYNLEQLAITSNGRFNPPFMSALDLYGSNILYAVPADEHQFTDWPSNPAAVQSYGPNGLPTSGAPVSLTGYPHHMPSTATYRFSVDAQYDVGHNWVATVGYQGMQSRHYTIQNNLNYLYYPNLNPMVQNMGWYANNANAHFNALNLEVQHRFSKSYEIDFQYRYSQSEDQGSHDYFMPMYPWKLSNDIGPSDFDTTHNIKLWGVWTPTFYRGSQYWRRILENGWTLSGIVTFHTGFPWNPNYCNTSGNVVYQNSGFWCLYPASYNGQAKSDFGNSTFERPNGNFPNGALAYFTVPTWPANGIPPQAADNVHRNMFRGPRYLGNDFQLAKSIGLPKAPILGENAQLKLQANFYNLFNKLNLGGVNNTISYDGVTSNPSFGQSQSAFSGRIVELQARFSF